MHVCPIPAGDNMRNAWAFGCIMCGQYASAAATLSCAHLSFLLRPGCPHAGSAEGVEIIPPGATVDPSGNPLPQAPTNPSQNSAPPPGAEAALQALDSAFGSAPLPLSSSLSGPLVPAIRIPSGALPLLAAPSDLLPVESPAGPAPASMGIVEPPATTGVPLIPQHLPEQQQPQASL